ncbi:class I SAM-dependent methyltransferase [Sellimonas catena]|uniref:Transcriptional regulator n=1 Tax=Sellimonas catena TaxID=2994035 RepID=A0A9W6FBX2_9FIRM|nr:class I SAM-dependent methyltransferase [Sellimonas catena]GLG03608.1 transcriptional regulator [Sellimonas catena]HIV95133.1 class I SAM-dependent methyltransferase [Candidatus Sellimonas avistercoris]
MYAQVAIKPNPLLRNGAYGIVMRGVQKCTRGCSSLRGRNKLPLCCIKLDTATELGCGTGDMWKDKEAMIASCSKLVLSDFSAGMVKVSKETVGIHDNVEYQVIDIQDIPFGDETFDIVIANMMLYHVPDLHRALTEVRRVLKKGGKFYCATYGEHGITEYLTTLFSEYGVEDSINKNFTLQNGYEILGKVFSKVEKLEYVDSLQVREVDDMVEYIYSLSSMMPLRNVPKQDVKNMLLQHTSNGILHVPKEYGMFRAE